MADKTAPVPDADGGPGSDATAADGGAGPASGRGPGPGRSPGPGPGTGTGTGTGSDATGGHGPASGRGPGPGSDTAAASGGPGAPARLWIVLLAACAGQFLVVLDVSVVNVALPSMRAGLGMDAAGLQWVLNGYTLAFAGLMLLGGRAADVYGRKRTFLVGLALFTAASLLGGLAQQPWHLLAARALQGTGAAVLAPATLTILTTAFPPGRARTRAIATWSAVGAGGGAAGGLVGGVLTGALSWRWVLLINVPVGALVLLAAAVWVEERRDAAAPRRLDLPGALLVTLGLGALAWGIVRTQDAGWSAPSVLWPLAVGAVLLALFTAVEARTRAPLVPLRLFRSRAVSAANGTMFVCGGALFCMWYFLSLYMQNVLHYTPLQAGLGFLPQSLSIVIGAKTAPRLMARCGARAVAVTGVVLAGAGCLWQSGMHAGGGFLDTVTGPGVLMALGSGLAGTPLASVAMSGVAHADAGLVSGLFNTARTMGGSLGLAVFSTIAAARIGDATGPATLAAGYGLAFRSAAAVLLLCAVLTAFVLPSPSRSEGAEA
ncbi:DHA2 family efflux MFS transporter permease subunit [Streptomyces sp. HNM0575]|uniref:DHA2 family efflux MFS transporter permease subunit n=1 Tax=Streptomyces sp. HNM0575 TaxID=2716338 RepID=UPI00145E5F0A|nr:DHA2 family efflux MFS transporter permease subunit [Streptomyces sp. HNM0575]NLU71722.1 DHA2 family efflux MFS transporter permease subunit [Streptomyces sp. HNM0575]